MRQTYTHRLPLLLRLKIGEFCLAILLFLLLFEVAIEEYVPLFGYLDEATALLMGVLAVIKVSTTRKRYLTVTESRMLALLMAMIALGLLSNMLSKASISWFAIVVDLLACSKFFIVLCSCYVLVPDSKNILAFLEPIGKVLCVVLFVFAIGNLFYDFGMASSERYGIRSFKFIFFHPGVVVWFTAALVAILLVNPKKNRVFIYVGLLTICMSLRAKGVCWAFAVFFLMSTVGKKGRINFLHVAVVLAGIGMFAADNIEMYYFNASTETARSALTNTSFLIANDCFPLGSGFATFGSSITATPEFYSPLYAQYGISGIWGIGIAHSNYISDSFWPTIVGQFGWVGLIAMCSIVFLLVKGILRRLDGGTPKYWIAPISLVMYLILGSAAESSFYNPQAVYFAITIALLCLNSDHISKKEVCRHEG